MILGTEERPVTLGWDIAGTIMVIGEEVNGFEVGDKVFGMVNFPGQGEVYAEYGASPANHLAIIPEQITFEEVNDCFSDCESILIFSVVSAEPTEEAIKYIEDKAMCNKSFDTDKLEFGRLLSRKEEYYLKAKLKD